MMNNRFIGGLIVVILAMGFIAYLHERGSRPEENANIGKPVFPKLKSELPNIQEVKFASANQTTTIEHKGNQWKIDEKDGYPADFSKLSMFLDSLVKAKYVEPKTSKPENFPILHLSGIDNSSSKAVEVSISTKDGSRFGLLIGKDSETESGHFVRKPSSSQTWLVDHVSDVTSDPLKWIEAVILSVDSNQVISVADTPADGKHAVIVKRDKDSGKFTVENLPKGATLTYPEVGDSLARALGNVRCTDVRARGSTPWKDAARAVYQFKDGSKLVIHAMKSSNGAHWLRFDLTKAKKPSEDISFINSTRLKDFEFKVADYTYSRFTKNMNDMIKQETKNKKKSAG